MDRTPVRQLPLIPMDDETVRFRYRDRAHGNVSREMTLDGVEFLRRFLLHVLPRGMVRIRYYGWLAPCNRAQLAQCRALIAAAQGSEQPTVDKDTAAAAPTCTETSTLEHTSERPPRLCVNSLKT